MKRPGIREVALAAGVSSASVSYVFSGRGRVSDETRRRVIEAATSLGYIRDDSAARLRTGESKLVGVILNNITNPFFSELVASLEAAVHKAGMLTLLATAQNDLRRQDSLLSSMLAQGVGRIILSPVHETDAAALRPAAVRSVPVVVCVRDVPGSGAAFVGVDDVLSGYLAARHLLHLGHSAFVFIGGYRRTTTWEGRSEGIFRALAEAGRPQDACNLIPGLMDPDFAEEKLMALAALGTLPSAVICFNDNQAAGAYRAARRLGLRVGRDISVVGFDNIPQGRILDPELTTVDIKPAQIGRIAAEMAIRGEGAAERQVLQPALVSRGSVARLIP